MEAQIMLVSAITDATRNWSAKVRVLTKLPIKTAIASPTKYQKMILADEMGDTVEAIMYKTDIDLYKNNLEVSKTYRISNAQVSKVRDMYRNNLVSSLYQWTITSRTSVMPVVEDTISCASFHPDFTSFRELAIFLGSKKPICTVCVIIERNTPKKVMPNNKHQVLYEYAAIDQGMTPFVVALWSDVVSEEIYTIFNDTHTRPVVALLNFFVKGYYGLSLSSGSSSVVLTEMDNQIFARMRTWRSDQRSIIDEMVEKGGFFEEKVGVRTGMAIPMNTISEVLQTTKVNLFNIKVRISLHNETHNYIYLCCGECRRGTNAAFNSVFRCNSCAVNRVAKPRFRFRVTATDDTGTMDITIFGKEGEIILGMSAHTFYDLIVNERIPHISSINQRVKDIMLFMKIKSAHFNGQNGKVTTTYNLLALEFADGFTDFEHPLVPPPENRVTDENINTNNSEGTERSIKRKLDFGSGLNSRNKPSTKPDFVNVVDVGTVGNLGTRSRDKGKAKIVEEEIPTETDATSANPSFEESTHFIASSDNDSIDDCITLSEIVRSNKVHQSSKKKPSNSTVTKLKKAKLHDRNLRQVVLDDGISETARQVGPALVEQKNPKKDPACQTSIKTSTRGRVIKPKKNF